MRGERAYSQILKLQSFIFEEALEGQRPPVVSKSKLIKQGSVTFAAIKMMIPKLCAEMNIYNVFTFLLHYNCGVL